MLRPKLNRIWASQSANSRRDPGDAKYLIGWISEIPTFQVLNFLQYKVDTTMLAQAERGIFEWGNDVQYRLASLVWNETNGRIYVSTVGLPDKNLAPHLNPTQWTESSIQVSRKDYDSITKIIQDHVADITTNPHKITAAMVDTYNKTQIDALVAQYRALVLNHVDDKNNPHAVTAAQVGAVPITGGTYTGDVIFQAGLFLDSAKTKQLGKAGGIYLQSNNKIIGISDSLGKAIVGDAGGGNGVSPIVLESTFPTLKAAREPEYASTYPIMAMDFIGNINIRTGRGTIDSGALNINYEGTSGAISLKNDSTGGTKQMTGDTNFLTGATRATIAIDVKSTTARNSDTQSTWYSVFGDLHIYETGSGRIGIEGIDRTGTATYHGAAFQLTGPINTWYRIVGVWEGNEKFKIYCDGVLMSSVAGTGTRLASLAGSKIIMSFNQRDAALQRTYQFRNMRAWTEALTPQQVSLL